MHFFSHTHLFTSAVGDRIVPVSSLQTVEARIAHQLVASPAAEHHFAAHEKVVALSATEIWKAGVFTLYGLWENITTKEMVINGWIREFIEGF